MTILDILMIPVMWIATALATILIYIVFCAFLANVVAPLITSILFKIGYVRK